MPGAHTSPAYLTIARRAAADRLLLVVVVGYALGTLISMPSWLHPDGFAWGGFIANFAGFGFGLAMAVWSKRSALPWIIEIVVPIGVVVILVLGVVESRLVGSNAEVAFIGEAMVLLMFTLVLSPRALVTMVVVAMIGLVAGLSFVLPDFTPLISLTSGGRLFMGGVGAIIISWMLEKTGRERHGILQRLEFVATTDSLTGLLNRRAFFERTASVLQRHHTARDGGATAGADQVCMLFIDLDHFKRINDAFGHATGDAVLRHVGRRLQELCRPRDLIGREGGEEFVVLLPGADSAAGMRVAERLRIGLPTGSPHPFTLCVGVACVDPNETVDDVLRRADKALYVAKNSGRDRIVFAPDSSDASKP